MVVARSALEILIGVENTEAKRELKELDKQLEEVDDAARDSGKGVGILNEDLLKMGAVAGGVTIGLVALGKGFWELGSRGAVVEQTTRSYDGLIEKLGVTPDLLEKQRAAVRGTVDDMTLMSATQTLLAGTSDEVGRELAAATPKLLEVAKAANKLNPSLGDTAFLYESIATGIKRGSPLILDNLGLTIKLGEANERYAKALGKTVEELTAEEKTIALLNDVAERSGDILIEQADGIDAVGDSAAQAEVKIKNLSDTWAKRVRPIWADVADVINDVIDGMFHLQDEAEMLEFAVDKGVISVEEMNHALFLMKKGVIGTEEVQAIFNKTLALTKSGLDEIPDAAGLAEKGLLGVRDGAEEAGEEADEYVKKINRLADEQIKVLNRLREQKAIKISEFFDVDLRVGDLAAQLFDITLFKQLGGEALSIMIGEVQAALVENKITPEQAREFFQNIAIEAAAIEVVMGEIDVEKAAESISKEFNVPLKEAEELINNVLGGLDLINSADISQITDEFDALQERKEILMEIGEIPMEADPDEEARQTLEDIQEQIDFLTDTPWSIDIELYADEAFRTLSRFESRLAALQAVYSEELELRKITKKQSVIPGFQSGGSFIVPSGFKEPHNPFLIGAESGEEVTIKPKGKANVDGDIIINVNNPQIVSELDVYNLAQQVAEVFKEKVR